MTQKPVVLIGAGGHASVIADACVKLEVPVVGYLAPSRGTHVIAALLQQLGDDTRLDELEFRGKYDFIIALGDIVLRRCIAARLESLGIHAKTIIHPSAIVGTRVTLGDGVFIAAGAIINAGSQIGHHAVINTGAIVDHDARLDDHVLVGPGAVLAGEVHCGNGVLIGAGASIRPGIRIDQDAVIGVGAAVVRNIEGGAIMGGVPAKPIRIADPN